MRASPELELIKNYKKRMHWKVNIHEIDHRKDNEQSFEKFIKHTAFIISLDERGENLKSIDLANKLQNTQNSHIQFLIGGADGLPGNIKKQSNFTLSFGKLTWPHMMVRAMLLEQIYRAQQIIAGHPYHRE